jgi:hypothetical protein
MHTFESGLLSGVASDAEYRAEHTSAVKGLNDSTDAIHPLARRSPRLGASPVRLSVAPLLSPRSTRLHSCFDATNLCAVSGSSRRYR